MSAAISCDWCHAVLIVDRRGNDERGERSAWLTVGAAGETLDLCSRACAVALIESDPFVNALEENQEFITAIVRAIKDADGEDLQ